VGSFGGFEVGGLWVEGREIEQNRGKNIWRCLLLNFWQSEILAAILGRGSVETSLSKWIRELNPHIQ
jgi:hypothetical protein